MIKSHVVVLAILTILCSISCNNSTGPGTGPSWTSVQLPGGALYHEVVFKNQLEGWVVGDSGRIFHTSDAGNKWSAQASGTGLGLSCASFVDARVGWAGGASGIIIRTTDGGVRWNVQRQPDETTGRILSMYFVDGQTGWAVSNLGMILHTSDSGTSWTFQVSGTQWAITSIWFVDDRRGWAVTANRDFLSTSDGGLHWSVSTLPFSSPLLLTDLFFLNKNIGWIATNIMASSAIQTGTPIMRTTDGGITWNAQATLPILGVGAIYFLDGNVGWLAGSNMVFRTSDGGLTWLTEHQADAAIFVSLSFTDANHGWVLSAFGQILRYDTNTP